jgi:hypothetical protein
MRINIAAFDKYVEKLGFKKNDFLTSENNLAKAEELKEELNFDRVESLELMNLNNENYTRIIEFRQNYPNVDLDHAINSRLSNLQVGEIMHATHYNHEVEFGSLKDRGKSLIDLSIIANENVDHHKARMICAAVNENLDFKELIININPENPVDEMHATLQKLRDSKLAVHQEIRNSGQDIKNFSSNDLRLFYKAHYNNEFEWVKPLLEMSPCSTEKQSADFKNLCRSRLEVHQYLRDYATDINTFNFEQLKCLYEKYQTSPTTFADKYPYEHLSEQLERQNNTNVPGKEFSDAMENHGATKQNLLSADDFSKESIMLEHDNVNNRQLDIELE